MKSNRIRMRLLKPLISILLVISVVLAATMMGGIIGGPFAPTKANASPIDDILYDVLDEAGLKSAADKLALFMGDDNKLEALQKAFQSVAGGDVSASAGGTAEEVSQVMKILQDLAATGNVGVSMMKAVPVDFSVEVDLPKLSVGGTDILEVRAWAEKTDMGTVSACIRLDGPGGSQALVGIGNDNPLGRGNAQHFANEMFIPYAFLDITRNGQSYVHLRVPLVGGLPVLKFEEYLPYGNKYIQVKVGAMDETSVELEFEISLKGTVDAAVSLEGEAKATLSVEASLAVANQLLTVMTKELADATQDAYSKYYNAYGEQIMEITPENAIDDATDILYRAISTVHSFSQADEEALGEISLGAELSGDVGLGVADTKWPGASLSAELGFSLSSGGLMDISKEMLENFVRFAPQMSNDMKILVDRILNDPAGFDERDIKEVWQQGGGKAFADAFFQRVADQAYGMEISASLDLAGEGDSSDGDNSTINVLKASLEIPEASIPETPDFIEDSLKAATMSLTGFLRFTGLKNWVPDGANPISIENDESIVEKMLDGATLSLATSLAPAVQLTADMPAKEFFEVFVGSPEYIIRQLAEANYRLSLDPIQKMLDTLWKNAPDALAALRNSTFGISIGGGANADLGAEAKISLSAGFNISAWTNVEMLLFLLGLDDSGISGNAGMKASVSAGVGAGVSLGEIVEFGAEGSMTINQNLLSFEFNEVDQLPPPLYYPYDSSNAFLLDIDAIPAGGGPAFNITPEFSPGNTVTVYNVWVPYNQYGQSFYLSLAKSHPGQEISVQEDKNSKQFYNPSDTYFIANTNVKKQFKIFVESQNRKGKREYTLNVRMLHSDKLSRLEMWEDKTSGDRVNILQGIFDPNTTYYSLDVGEHTSYLDIRMTKEDAAGARLKINGTEWDHNKFYRMYLEPGDNYIDIALSAEDVREPGAEIERVYRIVVNRALSSNANFSYATLSKGGGPDGEEPFEFDMSRDVSEQTVYVGSNVRSVILRFSTEENDTTVWRWYFGDIQLEPDTIGNEGSPSYTCQVYLAPGMNSFFLKSRAPDGKHLKYYDFKIYRAIPDYTDNPEFESLSMDYSNYDTGEPGNAGTFANPAEGVYHISFPEGVINASLNATIQTGRVESLEILGSAKENFSVTGKNLNTEWTLRSRQPLYFGPGRNWYVPIEITTESGKKALYLLILNGQGRTDNYYPHLEITDAGGKALDLSPNFDRDTKLYQITVPTDTDALKVFGWNENSLTYVAINGKLTQIPDLRQGRILGEPVTIELEQGINLIDMVVGSMDGSNVVYTVMVKREYLPERNPNAQSIVLSAEGGLGSRTLDVSKPKHVLDVDNGVDEITVGITPETHATAVIEFSQEGSVETINGYAGTFPLKVGENTINVTLTSQDGVLKQEYTIILNRLPSNDATLSLLRLNGTEVPEIKGVFSYSMYFPNNTENVTLEAAPTVTSAGGGTGASISVNGVPYEIGTPMVIPIEEGENPIKIIVTAEDNRTTRTMYIYAIRLGPPDIDPPNIAVEDITVEAASSEGAYVTYWPKAFDETDGFVFVNCTPFSGSLFPIGETVVTATASDKSGNTATATFKVIVQDTTPPAINAPAEILVPVDETGEEGTATFEGITAYDAVDGPVDVMITFRSGAKFPLGTTRVTCIAEDSRGNVAVKTFDVIVTDRVGVASSNPAKNSRNFDPASSITFTFNRDVELTEAASGISMKENGLPKEISYSLSADERTLTVTPAGGLKHGSVYTVTLPAGVAADKLDTESRSLPYVLSFRTAEAPPVAAETDGEGRRIILTFEKSMADATGKQAQFSAAVNGVERSISSVLQGSNKKQVVLVLEGPVLASSDTVTVSYTPGDLKTADGGIFNAFSGFEVENRTTFDGGTGTEEDPYLISNAAQLDAMRENPGAHYRLKGDIDLGSNDTGYGSRGWMPVGDTQNPFTGSLDGAGYTISGLSIMRLTEDNIGLFGVVRGGTLKNIRLTGVHIDGRNNVGALAGMDMAAGEGQNRGIRTNIRVSGRVSGDNNTGGIFGASGSDISEASFQGEVTGDENVGGIAGMLAYSAISESFARVDIWGYKYVGGLIGLLYGSNESGQPGTVTDCYSVGEIIAGNIYNINPTGGDINPTGCGGLVGFIEGRREIANSFAAVTMLLGGRTGSLIGGLVGNYEAPGISVTNSFYNSSVYGYNNDVYYGTPLTTLEMKSSEEFENAGWDFENVWGIGTGTYPYLRKHGLSDFAPPVLIGISPEDGARDVPLDSSLTLTFDEPLKYFRDGQIVKEITDPASLVSLSTAMDAVEFSASLSEDKKTITITPTGGMRGFLGYYLAVKRVGDNHGNLTQEIETDFITGKPLIESINVFLGYGDGDTIYLGSGTYMHAQIIPATAGVDTAVAWSVEPGTGNGTIDQDGWFVATQLGTVTVKATANDGSGISGTKVITVIGVPFLEAAIDKSEIPEGKDAKVNITVTSGGVPDGTVVISRLLRLVDSTFELVEGVEAVGVVMNNSAELELDLPALEPGSYFVESSVNIYSLGGELTLSSDKHFLVKDVVQLPAPGNFRLDDEGYPTLRWDFVEGAAGYLVTFTPVDPAGGDPITCLQGATNSLSVPQLPITNTREGTTYKVTIQAVPHESEKYVLTSGPSEEIDYTIRLTE